MTITNEEVRKDEKMRIQGNKSFITDEDVRLQNQPLSTDWVQMDASLFAYSQANKISVSGIETIQKFQVGDKLKVKQSDTYKYFYITDIEDGILYVMGEDDYTFTNNTVQEIYISRLQLPSGFPEVHTYIPTISDNAGAEITGWDTARMRYFMIGNKMVMMLLLYDTNFPAGEDIIIVQTPFVNGFNLQSAITFPMTLGSNDVFAEFQNLSAGLFTGLGISMEVVGGANFNSGNFRTDYILIAPFKIL